MNEVGETENHNTIFQLVFFFIAPPKAYITTGTGDIVRVGAARTGYNGINGE